MRLRKPDFNDPSVKRAVIIIVSAAVAIVITSSATVFSLTSQNFFCANACHGLMKYDVSVLGDSAHASTQCISCHIPPNIVSFAEHKVAALGELYMAVTGTYEWPINPKAEVSEEIPNVNCNLCHAIESRKVTTSAGIKINHKVHLDKGIKCSYCHNRVGHPNLKVPVSDEQVAELRTHTSEEGKSEKHEEDKDESTGKAVEDVKIAHGRFSYINMISMEGCTRCHGLERGAKAPGKCDTCHTSDFVLKPKNHLPAKWLQASLTNRAQHGHTAKKNRQYCSECHAQQFCQDCHKLATLPHPKSFKVAVSGQAEHAKIGTANPGICRKCHVQANFCTACHHKKDGYSEQIPWVAPKGSPMTHPGVVNKESAATCLNCHDERYCSSCHTKGAPDKNFLSKR